MGRIAAYALRLSALARAHAARWSGLEARQPFAAVAN